MQHNINDTKIKIEEMIAELKTRHGSMMNGSGVSYLRKRAISDLERAYHILCDAENVLNPIPDIIPIPDPTPTKKVKKIKKEEK